MMVAVCDPNPELFSNLEARRSITIESRSACLLKPTDAAELFPPPLANTDVGPRLGSHPGHKMRETKFWGPSWTTSKDGRPAACYPRASREQAPRPALASCPIYTLLHPFRNLLTEKKQLPQRFGGRGRPIGPGGEPYSASSWEPGRLLSRSGMDRQVM